MTDIEKLYEILEGEKPAVCMLAPSFVADFDYPEIIYKLRALGFDNVVELTFGAKMVNTVCYEIIKNDKSKTWIASPCPTLVQTIRARFPHLVENLLPVHSPMGAMALICEKFFPNHRRVFVGPCLTKKVEARELETVEIALTFKELEQIFAEKNPEVKEEHQETFDKFYNDYTKIYPLAGGMAQTMHANNILEDNQILTLDGIGEILKVLESFEDGKYKNYVFLDFLACAGGCIGGPGMTSSCSIEEKKDRILGYRDFAMNNEKDLGRRGKLIHAEDLDFGRVY